MSDIDTGTLDRLLIAPIKCGPSTALAFGSGFTFCPSGMAVAITTGLRWRPDRVAVKPP